MPPAPPSSLPLRTLALLVASVLAVTLASLSTQWGWNAAGIAVGLAIAIPGYAGYNYLVSRVNAIVLDMEKVSTEILNLVSDVRRP